MLLIILERSFIYISISIHVGASSSTFLALKHHSLVSVTICIFNQSILRMCAPMNHGAMICSPILEHHFALSVGDSLLKLPNIVQAALVLPIAAIEYIDPTTLQLILVKLASIHVILAFGAILIEAEAMSYIGVELSFILETDGLANIG